MGFEERDPAPGEGTGLTQGEFVEDTASYGGAGPEGYGLQDEIVALKARRRNKGFPIIPACVSFFVPWVLFIVTYAVTSFSIHYTFPIACWFIVALGGLVVLGGFGITIQTSLQGRSATWYAFLSILALIAVVLGACLGTANHFQNLRPYYYTNNMNRYMDVDPRNTTGNQMMDAGQITFIPGVSPDRSKSMGFKTLDMYCVTPIMTGAGKEPESGYYDFWAVGTNCCSGASGDFHCSEYDNQYAHSGLRVVDPDRQAFYRLAVKQAEAAYGIHASHPVFLLWMQDPIAELDAYADEGMMYFLVGIFSHLAFQVVAVGLGIVAISKFG